MKELSLNILDIVENSTKAKAELICIKITEENSILTIKISDDGYGMSDDTILSVSNPFYTTRTTRKVGMGIPLFRLAAEQTGGSLTISSKQINLYPEDHGTVVTASFDMGHIDFTPLGDIISTLLTLIQGHPTIDFVFSHIKPNGSVTLDTREIKSVLENVPIDTFEVLLWIKENLSEQYDEFNKK